MNPSESFGLDTEQAALQAKQGDETAMCRLIGAYRPLVSAVVCTYRPALKAHRRRPDFDALVDDLAEKCVPTIVEKWELRRGSFGAYAKCWGKRQIRDELCAHLCATDPLFSVDHRTKMLHYPNCNATIHTERAFPQEYEEWNSSRPATAADLFLPQARSPREAIRYGNLGCDRHTGLDTARRSPHYPARSNCARDIVVTASEVAGQELTAERIDDIVGPTNREIFRLILDRMTDVEIGAQLGMHRTTVVRHWKGAVARLALAARQARDRRLGVAEDAGTRTPDEEMLRWLDEMTLYRKGTRRRRPAELEPEIPTRGERAAHCSE